MENNTPPIKITAKDLAKRINQNNYSSYINKNQNFGGKDLIVEPINNSRANNYLKAQSQSGFDQLGNWAAQSIGTIAGDTVEGFGATYEGVKSLFTTIDDYDNWMMSLGRGIKEYSEEQFPIHVKNPNATFDWGDSGWWAKNMVSVSSALGLLIPAKGFSYLGKSFLNLNKTIKGLQSMKNGGKITTFATVGSEAVFMRNAENFMEAHDVVSKTKLQGLEQFSKMSDKEFNDFKIKIAERFDDEDVLKYDKETLASRIASKAGWHNYSINSLNIVFDVFQTGMMYRGWGGKTRMRSGSNKLFRSQAESAGTTFTKSDAVLNNLKRGGMFSLSAGSEGVEELVNAVSSEDSLLYGKNLLKNKSHKGFEKRLFNEYLQDPHIWEQGFFGMIGGAVFQGLGAPVNNLIQKAQTGEVRSSNKTRLGEIAARKVYQIKFNESLKKIKQGIDPSTGEKIEVKDFENLEDKQQELYDSLVEKTTIEMTKAALKVGNGDFIENFIKNGKLGESLVKDGEINQESADRITDIMYGVYRDVSKTYQENYKNIFKLKGSSAAKEFALSALINSRQTYSKQVKDLANLEEEINKIYETSPFYQSLSDEDKTNYKKKVELDANRIALEIYKKHLQDYNKKEDNENFIKIAKERIETLKKEIPSKIQEDSILEKLIINQGHFIVGKFNNDLRFRDSGDYSTNEGVAFFDELIEQNNKAVNQPHFDLIKQNVANIDLSKSIEEITQEFKEIEKIGLEQVKSNIPLEKYDYNSKAELKKLLDRKKDFDNKAAATQNRNEILTPEEVVETITPPDVVGDGKQKQLEDNIEAKKADIERLEKEKQETLQPLIEEKEQIEKEIEEIEKNDDGSVKQEAETIDDFLKNNNITEQQLKDEENKLKNHLDELGLKLDTEYNFEDIINRIIKNVKGRFLKTVLKGINSLVGNKLKTKFVFSSVRHEDAAGQYFSHDDTIKIYIPNLSLRVFTLNKRGKEYQQETNIVEVFNKVFIHELIHAFTILKIRATETNAKLGLATIMNPSIEKERLNISRSDQKTVDSLNKIFDFLKDNELLKGEYGVSDIVELVTEALSNEGFAEKLKSIELPKELRYKTGNNNVFENIILYISKLVEDLLNLGSAYSDDNALDSIAAIINDFGNSYSESDQQSFMKINKAEERAREYFKYGKSNQSDNLGSETTKLQQLKQKLAEVNKKIDEVTKRFDAQIAQKQSELKALEEQSTTSNQSDIERRRPTSYIRDSKDKKSPLETFRNEAKREWDGVSVITGDRMKNLYVGIQLFVEAYPEHKDLLDKFIKKENGTIGITNNNLSFVLNTLKKQGVTTESELGVKINAKYDAELAALKASRTKTPTANRAEAPIQEVTTTNKPKPDYSGYNGYPQELTRELLNNRGYSAIIEILHNPNTVVDDEIFDLAEKKFPSGKINDYIKYQRYKRKINYEFLLEQGNKQDINNINSEDLSIDDAIDNANNQEINEDELYEQTAGYVTTSGFRHLSSVAVKALGGASYNFSRNEDGNIVLSSKLVSLFYDLAAAQTDQNLSIRYINKSSDNNFTNGEIGVYNSEGTLLYKIADVNELTLAYETINNIVNIFNTSTLAELTEFHQLLKIASSKYNENKAKVKESFDKLLENDIYKKLKTEENTNDSKFVYTLGNIILFGERGNLENAQLDLGLTQESLYNWQQKTEVDLENTLKIRSSLSTNPTGEIGTKIISATSGALVTSKQNNTNKIMINTLEDSLEGGFELVGANGENFTTNTLEVSDENNSHIKFEDYKYFIKLIGLIGKPIYSLAIIGKVNNNHNNLVSGNSLSSKGSYYSKMSELISNKLLTLFNGGNTKEILDFVNQFITLNNFNSEISENRLILGKVGNLGKNGGILLEKIDGVIKVFEVDKNKKQGKEIPLTSSTISDIISEYSRSINKDLLRKNNEEFLDIVSNITYKNYAEYVAKTGVLVTKIGKVLDSSGKFISNFTITGDNNSETGNQFNKVVTVSVENSNKKPQENKLNRVKKETEKLNKSISKTAENFDLGEEYNEIFELADKSAIKLLQAFEVKDDERNATYVFDKKSNHSVISLSTKWLNLPKQYKKEVLVHELIHSFVRERRNKLSQDGNNKFNQRLKEFILSLPKISENNSPHINEVLTILKNVVENDSSEGAYSKLDEVVTYGLSDNEFANFLNNIKIEDTSGKTKKENTLWNKLTDIIKDIISSVADFVGYSKLDELNSILNEFLEIENNNDINNANTNNDEDDGSYNNELSYSNRKYINLNPSTKGLYERFDLLNKDGELKTYPFGSEITKKKLKQLRDLSSFYDFGSRKIRIGNRGVHKYKIVIFPKDDVDGNGQQHLFNELSYSKADIENLIVSEKTIRDLAARLSHRIGINHTFIADKSKDFKGKIENKKVVINLANATLDTPIHEILGHPIIRVIKGNNFNSSDFQNWLKIRNKGQFNNSRKDYLSDEQYIKVYKKEIEEYTKETGKTLYTENSQLYQNLLKELEYGTGQEILNKVKKVYNNKYKEPNIDKNDYEVRESGFKSLKTNGFQYVIKHKKTPYDNTFTHLFDTKEEGERFLEKETSGQFIGKYTLEEQQEEAIVTLLSLYTAKKLDAVKDGKIISLLKRLLQEIKFFIKDLLKQKEVEIDKLPENMTIGDIADLLAYSNSKLILPGNEVEYTTPDNKKFKTYQEASNHISELAKSVKNVDLSSIKVENVLPERFILNEFDEHNAAETYYKENGQWYLETQGDTFVNKEKITEEKAKEDYIKYAKYQGNLNSFIEKNKEYEQSKEIIEEWKKVNNIQYNPEEVYSRGQGFYSAFAAYSDLDLDTLMANILHHIEDNEKAGGKFALSAFTKPIDKTIRHIEKSGLNFIIFPKPEHIMWAANTDVFSGSVWDASEKVNKDKKSELLGVSYTKYPSLQNINSVQSNLASVVDDLAHHHNELGIRITGNNFRLEINKEVLNETDGQEYYKVKSWVDKINSILDQKYGKLVKPEIKKEQVRKIYDVKTKYGLQKADFNSEKEARDYINELNAQYSYSQEDYDDFRIVTREMSGIQPTQTKETLKESIEGVKNKIQSEFKDSYFNEYYKDGYRYVYLTEYDIYSKQKDGELIDITKEEYERNKPKKEYTSQALINTKIAALKEVAKKYPRTLIRSEVKRINYNIFNIEEREDDFDMPFSKELFNELSYKDNINDFTIEEEEHLVSVGNWLLNRILLNSPNRYKTALDLDKNEDFVYEDDEEQTKTIKDKEKSNRNVRYLLPEELITFKINNKDKLNENQISLIDRFIQSLTDNNYLYDKIKVRTNKNQNIDLDNPDFLNDNVGWHKNYGENSNAFPTSFSINDSVKLLFSTTAKTNKNNITTENGETKFSDNGKIILKHNFDTLTGIPEIINFDEVYPKLSVYLINCFNPQEMMSKLLNYGLNVDSSILNVYNKLMDNKDLQIKMFVSFDKQLPFESTVLYSAQESFRTVIGNESAIPEYIVADDFMNTILEKIYLREYDKSGFSKDANNDARSIYGKLTQLVKNSTSDSYVTNNIERMIKVVEESLSFIGIMTDTINVKDYLESNKKYLKESNYSNPLQKVLGLMNNLNEIVIKDKNYSNKNIEQKDLNKIIKNFKSSVAYTNVLSLAKDLTKYHNFTQELMSRTVDGQTQYNLRLHNFVSEWAKLKEHKEEFYNYLYEIATKDSSMQHDNYLWNTSDKNPGFLNYKIVEDSTTKRKVKVPVSLNEDFINKVNISVIGGGKNESTGEGNKYTKLNLNDWRILKLSNFISSINRVSGYPFMTPSDSATNYFLHLPTINFDINSAENGSYENTEIFKAIRNTVFQEMNNMKMAADYIFKKDNSGNFLKDDKGELIVKDENNYEIGSQKYEYLLNYHYEIDEKTGNRVFSKGGIPVGKVFQFSKLSIKKQGVVETLEDLGLKSSNGFFENIGTNKEKLNGFIDRFIKNQVNDGLQKYSKHKNMFFNSKEFKEESKNYEGNNLATFKENTFKNGVATFMLNQYLANNFQQNYFNGNSSFYSGFTDILKRGKQAIANGVTNTGYDEYCHFVTAKDVKEFGTFFDKELINTTDGQSYITWSEFKRRIKLNGKESEFKILIDILDSGRDLNQEEVESLKKLQSQKNFYYGYVFDESLGFSVPVQIKNSEVILSPSFIKKRPEFEEIAKFLEDNNIGQLNYASTQKMGTKYIVSIHDKNGVLSLNDLNKKELINSKQKLHYKNLKEQLALPDHFKDEENKTTAQFERKIVNGIDYDATYEITDSNEVLTGRELDAEISQLKSDIVRYSHNKLVRELGLKNIKNDISKLQNKLISKAIKTGENSNIIETLKLINNKFNVPLFFGTTSKKYQAAINSLFTNNIVNRKHPGVHGALISGNFFKTGTKKVDFDSYINKTKGVGLELIERKRLEEDLTLKFSTIKDGEQLIIKAEVFMPSWTKKMFKNGERVDINTLDEDVRTMLGYRTPTEGKYSMIVFEVVGFLPESSGSTIVVPHDFIYLSGMDFDIDSLYTLTYNLEEDSNGKLVKITYKTIEGKKNKEELLNKARQNRLLDLYISIIRNKEIFINEGSSSSNFKDVEEAKKEVDILLGINNNNENPLTDSGQEKYRSMSLDGRDLKGMAVNRSTILSFFNKIGVKLDVDIICEHILDKEIYDKLVKENKYNFIEAKNLENNKVKVTVNHNKFNINSNFTGKNNLSYASQSLANILDNVKFPLPFSINIESYGTWQTLVDLGFTWEYSTNFISSPIIQELLTTFISESGIFSKSAKFNNVYHKILNNKYGKILENVLPLYDNSNEKINEQLLILDKLFLKEYNKNQSNDKKLKLDKFKELNLPRDYSKIYLNYNQIYNILSTDSFKNIINVDEYSLETFFNKETLDTIIKNKEQSNGDILKEIALLNNYFYLKDITSKIEDGINAFSLDRIQVGPNSVDLDKINNNMDKVRKDGLLVTENDENLVDVVYPDKYSKDKNQKSVYPILQDLYNYAFLPAINLSNQFFISSSPLYKEILNDKRIAYKTDFVKKEFVKFLDAYLLKGIKLFSNIDYARVYGRDYDYIDLNISDKNENSEEFNTFLSLSTANKLNLVKKYLINETGGNNSDNLLNYLIYKISYKNNNEHIIKYTGDFTKSDALIKSFEKLLNNSNPFIKDLAEDLVVYSYATTGLNYSDYSNIIPISWLNENENVRLSDYLYTLQDIFNEEGNDLENLGIIEDSFFENFYTSNSKITSLVPIANIDLFEDFGNNGVKIITKSNYYKLNNLIKNSKILRLSKPSYSALYKLVDLKSPDDFNSSGDDSYVAKYVKINTTNKFQFNDNFDFDGVVDIDENGNVIEEEELLNDLSYNELENIVEETEQNNEDEFYISMKNDLYKMFNEKEINKGKEINKICNG